MNLIAPKDLRQNSSSQSLQSDKNNMMEVCVLKHHAILVFGVAAEVIVFVGLSQSLESWVAYGQILSSFVIYSKVTDLAVRFWRHRASQEA